MIYPVRGAPKRIKGIKETSPAILMRLYRSCLSTNIKGVCHLRVSIKDALVRINNPCR